MTRPLASRFYFCAFEARPPRATLTYANEICQGVLCFGFFLVQDRLLHCALVDAGAQDLARLEPTNVTRSLPDTLFHRSWLKMEVRKLQVVGPR